MRGWTLAAKFRAVFHAAEGTYLLEEGRGKLAIVDGRGQRIGPNQGEEDGRPCFKADPEPGFVLHRNELDRGPRRPTGQRKR